MFSLDIIMIMKQVSVKNWSRINRSPKTNHNFPGVNEWMNLFQQQEQLHSTVHYWLQIVEKRVIRSIILIVMRNRRRTCSVQSVILNTGDTDARRPASTQCLWMSTVSDSVSLSERLSEILFCPKASQELSPLGHRSSDYSPPPMVSVRTLTPQDTHGWFIYRWHASRVCRRCYAALFAQPHHCCCINNAWWVK